MKHALHDANLGTARDSRLQGNRFYHCCQAIQVASSFYATDGDVCVESPFLGWEPKRRTHLFDDGNQAQKVVTRLCTDPENPRMIKRGKGAEPGVRQRERFEAAHPRFQRLAKIFEQGFFNGTEELEREMQFLGMFPLYA